MNLKYKLMKLERSYQKRAAKRKKLLKKIENLGINTKNIEDEMMEIAKKSFQIRKELLND